MKKTTMKKSNMKQTKKKNNAFMYGSIVLGVIVLFLIVQFVGSNKDVAQDALTQQTTGDVQRVDLSMRNGNYYPQLITVSVNKPVQLAADNTVSGCGRSISIPEFGVRKTVSASDNTVTFTPTKTGDFVMTCSMGMMSATLRVEG